MATAPAYIQNALSTLDDRQWLCSDAIDESIQGILTSSSSQDVCLLCPTYIYQSVAMDSFDIAFTYLKRNDALNKDILIIPLNLDPQGKGTHWCLAVANFRVREIWIFDSMSNEANEGTLFIFSNLLWIVGAAYEIADTDFIRSSWRCIFSTDTQKATKWIWLWSLYNPECIQLDFETLLLWNMQQCCPPVVESGHTHSLWQQKTPASMSKVPVKKKANLEDHQNHSSNSNHGRRATSSNPSSGHRSSESKQKLVTLCFKHMHRRLSVISNADPMLQMSAVVSYQMCRSWKIISVWKVPHLF